jgi:hypothetical protein
VRHLRRPYKTMGQQCTEGQMCMVPRCRSPGTPRNDPTLVRYIGDNDAKNTGGKYRMIRFSRKQSPRPGATKGVKVVAASGAEGGSESTSNVGGCCWVMQCSVARPGTRSRQGVEMTSRSGNNRATVEKLRDYFIAALPREHNFAGDAEVGCWRTGFDRRSTRPHFMRPPGGGSFSSMYRCRSAG